MQISSIELTNVKSYKTARIELVPGVNAICGENGSGKTTLLEAIGYALFDVPPYRPIELFVREGEKTGTIVVSLDSSRDDRGYQVIRKFGAVTDYYIYDPELQAKLVEGKSDVWAWLAEQLGVESVDALRVLFTDAVGVPQGQLTAAFQLKPADRKLLFDRLLQVEEYDRAAKELLDTSRYIKDEIGQRREKAAEWEGQVRALLGQVKDVEQREAAIAIDQTQLDKLNAEFKVVSKDVDDLEQQKQSLDALNSKASTLKERVQGLTARHESASREVDEAHNAKEVAGKARPGYDAYLAADKELGKLDDQRQVRDQLKAKINSLDGKRLGLTASLQGLDEQLLSIQNAEKQMSELQPRVEQQDALEIKLAGAEQRVEQRRQTRERLGEEKDALAELDGELAKIEKEILDRQQLESTAVEARARLSNSDAEVTGIDKQAAVLEAERQRLAHLEPILADAVGATCPVCQQPLSPAHRKSVLKEARERGRAIKGEEAELRLKQKTADAQRKAVHNELEGLQTRLGELARASDQRVLERKIGKKRNEVAAWQDKLDALADAVARVKALKEDLKDLGNPRKSYLQLEGKTGDRAQVDRDRRKAGDRLALIVEEAKSLDKSLKDYVDLDQKIALARGAQKDAKADHQVYLNNTVLAEKLPALATQLAAIAKDLTKATAESDGVRAALAEVQVAYDARRHKRLSERHAVLVGQRQGLVERIQLQRTEVKKLEAEIKRLHKVQKDLRALNAEIEELDQVRTLVEYIRNLLKTAGPYITRLLVQAVSQRAAQLYAEIMSDTLASLNWSESYELILEAAGRERHFAQLSGGEQMAAALSVRLSLLRELSTIDLAFFDEPTSNLDETRRDNVAEQMVKVSGFSQLFVISHDDTFERLTDHAIRLAKVNGQSQVNVA